MKVKLNYKKIISLVLIIIILSNIIPFKKTKANIDKDIASIEDRVDLKTGVSEENYNSMMDNGTVTVEPSDGEKSEKSITDTLTFGKTTSKILAVIMVAIPAVIYAGMCAVVWDGHQNIQPFTIGETISGKYNIFDIDFWKKSETATASGESESISDSIKKSVASWYSGCRNLAAILMVIIAIYIGIRMAIATAAEEQARYKSMFINWFKGLVLMFFIHYILIAIIMFSNRITRLLNSSIENAFDKGIAIEKKVKTDTLTTALFAVSPVSLNTYGTQHPLYNAILYIFLIITYLKFFKMYFYRMLKIMFLVIISPIMCATFAIDKISDNRSQALDNFITEFVIMVFQQPIQLLLYLVFIGSSDKILEQVRLLLIVFFFAMGSMEKTVRQVIIRGKSKFVRGLNDIKLDGKSDLDTKPQ